MWAATARVKHRRPLPAVDSSQSAVSTAGSQKGGPRTALSLFGTVSRDGNGTAIVSPAVMRWMFLLAAVLAAPVAPEPRTGPVGVDFQNVHFHVAPGVVMEVRHLQGALVSTVNGGSGGRLSHGIGVLAIAANASTM